MGINVMIMVVAKCMCRLSCSFHCLYYDVSLSAGAVQIHFHVTFTVMLVGIICEYSVPAFS